MNANKGGEEVVGNEEIGEIPNRINLYIMFMKVSKHIIHDKILPIHLTCCPGPSTIIF